jgi:hypothetical protein
MLNPMLNSSFVPQASVAVAYGAFAR